MHTQHLRGPWTANQVYRTQRKWLNITTQICILMWFEEPLFLISGTQLIVSEKMKAHLFPDRVEDISVLHILAPLPTIMKWVASDGSSLQSLITHYTLGKLSCYYMADSNIQALSIINYTLYLIMYFEVIHSGWTRPHEVQLIKKNMDWKAQIHFTQWYWIPW